MSANFFLQCVKSVYKTQEGNRLFFFLDINAKIPNLSAMNITYRKGIVWFVLVMYLMLAPVPLLNDGNLVLCVEDACADCHGGNVLASRQAVCEPGGDEIGRASCRERV